MLNYAGAAATYFRKLHKAIAHMDHGEIDAAVGLIAKSWRDGQQIITMGNGGSSLTALHFVNDWNKAVFLTSGTPFRGRSLVDNTGLLMSYANDISFQDVFIEQLKNVLELGDLVVAISGSGNSENVIRAVDYANKHGAVTLGLCGYSGGRLKSVAQHVVWAPVEDMQLAEDLHAMFGHIVMQSLCGMLL
jgi:D-sedoheptulose 7-phosphate isomerase